MKVSVCIPNYNYEMYLGRTLDSVLSQKGVDLEVLVSDNASTDGSAALVENLKDPRVSLNINPCNVGFSGNLDRAARLARGDVMLMLSSDDLMRPGALGAYEQFYAALGRVEASRAVVTSASEIIDPDDATTGRIGPDAEIWLAKDLVSGMSVPAGTRVYRVEGDDLLRRCLATMKNPFNFLATAYPRGLYERVGGYGGGRLINPDKWFHWKLAGAGTACYYIDLPLFAYRVHPSNQAAQQAAGGALKLLVDDYASVIEIDAMLLERLGVERQDVEKAFVDRDIARHGLAELARGRIAKARRILGFGASVYPQHALRNKKLWALAGCIALGPAGEMVAKLLYRRRLRSLQ